MNPIGILAFLILLASTPLWANPGLIENGDYKITLSETLPGVDDPGNPQAPPTITAGVLNKFNNSSLAFTLDLYSVNNYYLLEDALILIGRSTSKWASGPPEYSLYNLNLTTTPNSQEFKNIKIFSISPDNESILATVDGGGKPDPIGIINFNNQPGQWEWLEHYPPEGSQIGVSLIQAALPGPVKSFFLSPAVGWSGDSESAVIVVSADDGTQDSQGNPVLKNYLALVEMKEKGPAVSIEPLDLSSYHVKDGTRVDKIDCGVEKITLTLITPDSPQLVQVDFPFPTAAKN